MKAEEFEQAFDGRGDAPRGQVAQEVKRLSKTVSLLGENLANLEARLHPVLRTDLHLGASSPEEKSETVSVAADEVPLAREIAFERELLTERISVLVDLTERIEL